MKRPIPTNRLLHLIVVFLIACFVLGMAPGKHLQAVETIDRLDANHSALVFQSDFGTANDAVASMKGVAFGVDSQLKIFDLTHEIEPFNIWEGAYWLHGAASYWPENTVFVSVVDPGVGTNRKSVVLKTENNQYFVTPDNGTLTLVAENYGIAEIREIDEAVNRLEDSEKSYTFHGRDVYAYTGARLASGTISFEEVGQLLDPEVVMIDYQKAQIEEGILMGIITVIDQPYGNVWTNIPRSLLDQADIQLGDWIQVTIHYNDEVAYEGSMPYVETFGGVEEGEPLCYANSQLMTAFAINWGNFQETAGVDRGFEWTVKIEKQEELAYTEEIDNLLREDHHIPFTLTMPLGQGPFPAVVMCHGNGSDRHEAGGGYDLIAPKLAEHGIASLRYDYIGNGDSKEDYIDFTHDKGVEDALTCLEYLGDMPQIDQERLGIMGWSQGGGIALVAASRDDSIQSVMTWAGAMYDGRIDETKYETAKQEGYFLAEYSWRDPLKLSPAYFESLQDFIVADAIPTIDAPILALNGSDDSVIPPETAEQIVALSTNENSEAYILNGADHTFHIFTDDMTTFNELMDITIAWFEKTLK